MIIILALLKFVSIKTDSPGLRFGEPSFSKFKTMKVLKRLEIIKAVDEI